MFFVGLLKITEENSRIRIRIRNPVMRIRIRIKDPIGCSTVMMILQALKFVSLVHLSAVRRLVDVLDSAEAESGVIALGSLFHTHHCSHHILL